MVEGGRSGIRSRVQKHGELPSSVESGGISSRANRPTQKIDFTRGDQQFRHNRKQRVLQHLSEDGHKQDGAAQDERRRIARGHAESTLGKMGRMVKTVEPIEIVVFLGGVILPLAFVLTLVWGFD